MRQAVPIGCMVAGLALAGSTAPSPSALAEAAPRLGRTAAWASNPCAGLVADVDPNIRGDVNGITSPRFMRRLWIKDRYLLGLFQQGGLGGRYLALYRLGPGDDPRNWHFVGDVAGSVAGDEFLSGDGFLTDRGHLVLVVSSRQQPFVADVKVFRYEYHGGGDWQLDVRSPVTVAPSSEEVRRFHATIAKDSLGRLFVAYVTSSAGAYAVRYAYSVTGGADWVEAAKEFTANDPYDHKSSRVSAVSVAGSDAIAIVFYDQDASGEYLRWDYRLDSVPQPEDGWTFAADAGARQIARMPDVPFPDMHRHWSVARDASGGLHVSYEGRARIFYSGYDGNALGSWAAPVLLGDGTYSSISASVGGAASFIYVFSDTAADTIVARAYDPLAGAWTDRRQIGAGGRGVHRRVSSPEQFTGGPGSQLTVVFQNDLEPPGPATQNLFSVLRDCR